MAQCEDFPCCGHERGCCPTYRNGKQIDMVCTCGVRLPITNHSSICDDCLDRYEEDERDADDAFRYGVRDWR